MHSLLSLTRHRSHTEPQYRCLYPGTVVNVNGNAQYHCLYPGTVVNGRTVPLSLLPGTYHCLYPGTVVNGNAQYHCLYPGTVVNGNAQYHCLYPGTVVNGNAQYHCLYPGTVVNGNAQYHCLYPGTVVNGSSDGDDSDDLITVEFDDGDTGRIPLSHIRLLPPDYKIQCAEPSPALLVASCSRRRVRKCSKDTSETKPKTGDSAPKGRGRPAKKPKPKPEPPVSPDPRETIPPPGPSQAPDRPQLPTRPAQDRPSSSQRPAQERPLSAPRPGPGRPSKPTSTPSLPAPPRSQNPRRPSPASPKPPSLYHPAPYGKILRVDLYSQPNLTSCNVSTQPNPKTNPKSKLSLHYLNPTLLPYHQTQASST
ncbi:trinucleotide repeat-containing gene 18 protein-like [Oncorhynchus keta]|uniref:trinucleotide repeat-containing gene 18 protein-like n=1 Tax=Oncorhynchus keta TaxID=8018 RepID=UPI00227C290C|nr:trinucleotide repeat-containing gene 18 protein-like [Oncorhynchus keta]